MHLQSMETVKYSDSLEIYNNDIENPALQDSLESLKKFLDTRIRILDWGNGKVAIPVEICVDLPSLGNFQNLDIRNIEPVIMVFDLNNYPVSAPKVYTDRLDFPKNNLAHLYIAVNHRPPAFCYVRGNADEWYANKRIEDLAIRIGNWLRDAATGELTENGDQYEPLRLEGYSGNIIYDYDTIRNLINNNEALIFGDKFSVALFERSYHATEYTYKFLKFITDKNGLITVKEVDEERKKGNEDMTKKKYYYGFILWDESNEIKAEYEVNIPRTWEDFKSFCQYYNIKYEDFEKFVATTNNLNEYVYFPVIIAIRRPKKLIGYSSNIEFVNLRFKIDSDDVNADGIINNISVDILAHNQPLTYGLAKHISGDGITLEQRSAVFGCGALGSKIVMHLARSGYTKLTLIDPDHISPHNLVRHSLFAEDEGENKAEALAEKIRKMYPYEQSKILNGISFKEGLMDAKETFEQYGWLLDFTASDSFFNKLLTVDNLNNLGVISAAISNFGGFGIMYKEGKSRSPRIDDLQVYLYSLYKTEKYIREWLQSERMAMTFNNLTVQVGVGCNSETTVLSDDKISSHGSFFAGVIKKEMSLAVNHGKIFLNYIIDTDEDDYSISTQTIHVEPFDIFQAENDSTWSIRFKSGVLKALIVEFSDAGNIETGGVFVGVVNYKTKTIHVTDLVKAPSDSVGTATQFIRGNNGLVEIISEIEKESGGQIGYIGEWHTHPDGPDFLSAQDIKSVKAHKEECKNLQPPLPVFLSILTPNGIFPYVF